MPPRGRAGSLERGADREDGPPRGAGGAPGVRADPLVDDGHAAVAVQLQLLPRGLERHHLGQQPLQLLVFCKVKKGGRAGVAGTRGGTRRRSRRCLPGEAKCTSPEPGPRTLPDGVRGHEHRVQPVGLHEAADRPHGPVQAGHVLPVAPDEVLPPQVNGEVRAAQRGAQRDLRRGTGTLRGVRAAGTRDTGDAVSTWQHRAPWASGHVSRTAKWPITTPFKLSDTKMEKETWKQARNHGKGSVYDCALPSSSA